MPYDEFDDAHAILMRIFDRVTMTNGAYNWSAFYIAMVGPYGY